MDDAEEQDRKPWELRKRKAIYTFEEDYDSGSSDYKPPKDLEGDSSDDSVLEARRRVKKCKKKKTSHSNADSETTEKNPHKILNGSKDDSSDDCISEVKKEAKENTKRKTRRKGARQEVRGKKSRARRPVQEKPTAQEKKKKKKKNNNRGKEKGSKSQQIQKSSSGRAPHLGPYSVTGKFKQNILINIICIFSNSNKSFSLLVWYLSSICAFLCFTFICLSIYLSISDVCSQ